MAGIVGSVSGKDASITFAQGYVAKCTAWTLDIAADGEGTVRQ